jgi:ribosomal protein L37AE/L43A
MLKKPKLCFGIMFTFENHRRGEIMGDKENINAPICPQCGRGFLKVMPDGVTRCMVCGYRPDKNAK